MYNRYIPPDTAYIPAEETPPEPPRTPEAPPSQPAPAREESSSPLSGLQEKLSGALSGLEKLLPRGMDLGDVLLILIVLCLLAEGEDWELAAALGVVLLLDLWEARKETE